MWRRKKQNFEGNLMMRKRAICCGGRVQNYTEEEGNRVEKLGKQMLRKRATRVLKKRATRC